MIAHFLMTSFCARVIREKKYIEPLNFCESLELLRLREEGEINMEVKNQNKFSHFTIIIAPHSILLVFDYLGLGFCCR